MLIRLLSEAIRILRTQHWAARALVIAAVYAIWTALFRLLILTFITYFLIPPGALPTSGPGFWLSGSRPPSQLPLPRFEEITEILSANELPLLGLSAALFLALLRWLNPLTSTTRAEIVDSERLKRAFAPGALHGTTIAVGVVLALVISGAYSYLGAYLQFDELALTLPSILLRIGAIIVLVYCEEFIFRRKILNQLRAGIVVQTPFGESALRGELLVAGITGILYCGTKSLQFELGTMQLLTLFLASLVLGIQSIRSGDFARGAGFWAAILVNVHVLFSLPILGTDFSGIFLVKHQPAAADTLTDTIRLLSGGAGGPLSSIALQILLLIELGRSVLRKRKYFRSPSTTR